MREQQFNEISAWQKQTFGQATPLSKIAHLAEEMQELISDLKTNNPDRRLEFADCFFLLFGSAAADGITLSRWRRESIKSMGNAIVPQEAYEIFKVIDKF